MNGERLKQDSSFDSGRTLTSVLTRLAQDAEAIDAEAVQVDTQAAVETLQTLQSQLEEVSISHSLHHGHPKLT